MKPRMEKITMFNVWGTQNMACTTAWFTMYLTASGPAEQTKDCNIRSQATLGKDVTQILPDQLMTNQEYHTKEPKCTNKPSRHDQQLATPVC